MTLVKRKLYLLILCCLALATTSYFTLGITFTKYVVALETMVCCVVLGVFTFSNLMDDSLWRKLVRGV